MNDSSIRVLITDGGERSVLAAARSLVAAGYEVYVTGRKTVTLAGVSRGVRPCVVREDPLADPAGYAGAIARLATDVGAALLIPATDPSTEALVAHRELLPATTAFPLPEVRTYQEASDKFRALVRAEAAGFAIPRTALLATPERNASVIPANEFFPAVIKPHRSVIQAPRPGAAKQKIGVSFVRDRAECDEALAALPPTAYPVLLQSRVRGPGEGLFALRWNGRVIAQFAHRRLREKPPAGGVSVYRESIAIDPALAAAGRRLLDSLNWQGVAMIECKRDVESGDPVFMELNGRIWGSLQLAIDAGIDFPALLAACALGASVPPTNGYRLGVRSRWFWGDVDHVYLRFTKSARELHLEPHSPSRLATLLEFLRLRPGRDREEIWRWRDPAPFMAETLQRLGILR